MKNIERLVECLRLYNPDRIIIFGSYARGDADEYSDMDVVVIKDTEKRFLDRLIEVAKYLDNDLGKVDVFVYTSEEFNDMIRRRNPFVEKVLKEGRVIYQA
ncbi:nucleotidyltransferase domain-containing protein [Desulfobacterota bacterium AH_259_B03_O07]|nr:nucleotidyltransferase domain-containing protein [Desulfobacterota bacterium AH_259_B03_O07]